jgi:hypothetical protein
MFGFVGLFWGWNGPAGVKATLQVLTEKRRLPLSHQQDLLDVNRMNALAIQKEHTIDSIDSFTVVDFEILPARTVGSWEASKWGMFGSVEHHAP